MSCIHYPLSSRQKCGNAAPKTVKISNLAHKFAPQGRLVWAIFKKFTAFLRVQVAFKFLIWLLLGDKQPSYKHFPTVGALSLKFSITHSGKTTDRIKKSWGAKTGQTSSITMPSMGRAMAVDGKV